MILSFHPLILKDENRLCAGREPDADDLRAIKSADAVILPQGCYKRLYDMARENCRHVFPNYDARFDYPGKTGQARLFRLIGVTHPQTDIFPRTSDFNYTAKTIPQPYPFVFKFDWGGEGEGVFLIESEKTLKEVLERAARFEVTGQSGFVLQAYIPTGGRSLRVVVIGRRILSYWRIAPDSRTFASGLSSGGKIDPHADPDLQHAAKAAVAGFCRKTGINLAGFDILFRSDKTGEMDTLPIFLEINYFFGRRGLGGSDAYYKLLQEAVEAWLDSIPGLSRENKNGH